MRPVPPAPGETSELGLETLEARVCPDLKCACGQRPRYFARVDGALVGMGYDWDRMLHVRGHWPLNGLQLGDRLPKLGIASPNKKPPELRMEPQRPLLTQAELELMETQRG